MKQQIAQILLDSEAIFLRPEQPFTWASGIQSPIYCDNRRVLAFPQARSQIKNALLDLVKNQQFDAIMGTATAGIPMASLLADALAKPLGYVRGSAKSHGRNNQIEGFNQKGAKVLLIEDLISTGGSSIAAAQALREAGMEVVLVAAIFSYNLAKAEQQFAAAQLSYQALSDFNQLIALAESQGKIDASQAERLKAFQRDPLNW